MRTTKQNGRWLGSFCGTIVLTALAAITSFAQTSNTGAITGVVKDQNGAVVPGATVTVTNLGTNAVRTATTGTEGTYEIAQLVPGDYRLAVQAQSFAGFTQERVTVNVLSRVTVDPEMRPAGAVEKVTITTENTALVETTKTEVSGVIDQKQMESLPVNGRSFASLATLIPGVTLAPSFDPTKARVGTFSVGGSSGRNLNITVDAVITRTTRSAGFCRIFRWKASRSSHFPRSVSRRQTVAPAVLFFRSCPSPERTRFMAPPLDSSATTNLTLTLRHCWPRPTRCCFRVPAMRLSLHSVVSNSAALSVARSKRTKRSSLAPLKGRASAATRSCRAQTKRR